MPPRWPPWPPRRAAQGQAAFYVDGQQAAFNAAVDGRGLAVDSAEDFEDARRSNGLLGQPILSGPPTGPMDDPLDASTSNQFFGPGQIPAHLRFQSNRDNDGDGPADPAGQAALAIGQPSSAGDHATPTTISSVYA